jgi:hypothetical protein
MSTQSQQTANQANSKLSTGPKTEAGKAASSQNNYQHGLAGNPTGRRFYVLEFESQEDYDELYIALLKEYLPRGPVEHLLVESLAQHQWLRDRAQRLSERCLSETGVMLNEKRFALYLRYRAHHDRYFHKTLREFATLRAEKKKQQIGFESQQRKQAAHPIDLLLKEAEIDFRHMRTFAVKAEVRRQDHLAKIDSLPVPPTPSFQKNLERSKQAA